jgi:hypothetical protein
VGPLRQMYVLSRIVPNRAPVADVWWQIRDWLSRRPPSEGRIGSVSVVEEVWYEPTVRTVFPEMSWIRKRMRAAWNVLKWDGSL